MSRKLIRLFASLVLLAPGCRPNAPVPAPVVPPAPATGGPGAYVTPVTGSNLVFFGHQGSFSPLRRQLTIDQVPLHIALSNSTVDLTFTNLGVILRVTGSERLLYQGVFRAFGNTNAPDKITVNQLTAPAVWRATLPTNGSVVFEIPSGSITCLAPGSAWFALSPGRGQLVVREGTVFAIGGPPHVPPSIAVPAGSKLSHVNWLVTPASVADFERAGLTNMTSP